MAKAALEAISELDLFGPRGSQSSVIHVVHDQVAQCAVSKQREREREREICQYLQGRGREREGERERERERERGRGVGVHL